MSIPARQLLLIPHLADPLLQDNQAIGSYLKKEGTCLSIDQINWNEYPYKPAVKLCLGYSDRFLWLCYEVKHDFFRAKASADQEAVWEDSCVEFFIAVENNPVQESPGSKETFYRNFEFNVRGICLSAYGTKESREALAHCEMKRILRFPSVAGQQLPEEGTAFNWELVVAIPLDLLEILPGSKFKANFYKCGDLTRQPHFLSWTSIDAPAPDFHLPGFFGEAKLAD